MLFNHAHYAAGRTYREHLHFTQDHFDERAHSAPQSIRGGHGAHDFERLTDLHTETTAHAREIIAIRLRFGCGHFQTISSLIDVAVDRFARSRHSKCATNQRESE